MAARPPALPVGGPSVRWWSVVCVGRGRGCVLCVVDCGGLLVVCVCLWWWWFAVFLGSWDRYNTGSVVCGVVAFTRGFCRGLHRSLAPPLLLLLLLLLPLCLLPGVVCLLAGLV